MSTPNTNTRPEVRGKVIDVLPEWRNNAGTFWKREVVVETGYKYPSPIKVTFKKEATSNLDGVAVDDSVAIPYALDGREFDGKYYVDVVGLGLTKFEARKATATAKAASPSANAIDTWKKLHNGEFVAADFAAFCQQVKPGKASKDYTAADWGDVVSELENMASAEMAAQAEAEAAEELPF